MLETSFYGVSAQGENPRELEKRQIVKLMSSVAEAFYTGGKYDFARGTDKLENKIQKGEIIPDDHLRAHRIGREEILGALSARSSSITFNTTARTFASKSCSSIIFPNNFG
jgi:hypothetical protein